MLSSALYGLDLDGGDGEFNRAGVSDDYTVHANVLRVGHIDQFIDGFANTWLHPSIGVALVRATSVPEPTSILLMAFGLTGLGFSRRRKLQA